MSAINGEEKLKVEESWKVVEKTLNDYENKLSLNIKKSDKIEDILNLGYDELSRLDSQDCGVYAYLLQQYSMYLQKEINRHAAKKRWATHNIDVMAGKFAHTYGNNYTPYEERKLRMVNENSYAGELNKIVRITSVIIENFSYVARKVDSLADILQGLQGSKK